VINLIIQPVLTGKKEKEQNKYEKKAKKIVKEDERKIG
jgi:hypothetical protein